MITNKQFTDKSYDGWELSETCNDIDGTKLERRYDTTKTKSELLASKDWELPDVMALKSGEKLSCKNWQEHRKYLLDIIMEYGFGFPPAPPKEVKSKILYNSVDEKNRYAGVVKTYAGKATVERIMLTFNGTYGEFSFPIQLIRPIYGEKQTPAIIHIAFKPSLIDLPFDEDVDHSYAPIEEIIDNGFTYVQFCYNDVMDDFQRGDYKKAFCENGIGKVFFKGDKREETACGKVGMWAYAASRVLDYLLTRDDIDSNCISVAGHSRLGKTALWAAGQDERFFAALVNCSGFGGAGLMKGLSQRRLKDMIANGGIEWWNEKTKQYADNPTSLPYDAHFMVAVIAPRYISLVDADGDFAHYQLADFMSAAAASPVFEAIGVDGFISSEQLPRPSVIFSDGHIGYALRPGSHFFSRWDWNVHMEFIKKHRNKK